MLIAILVGGALGILSGYVGGLFVRVAMAAMDVLLSFPTLVMGLLVVAMLGPTVGNLVLAISLTAVAPFARIARAPTLSVKERDFVEAGRALGFSNLRIMIVHILPNVVDEILVMASLWLATAIRTEASLSFIGLGVRPPLLHPDHSRIDQVQAVEEAGHLGPVAEGDLFGHHLV